MATRGWLCILHTLKFSRMLGLQSTILDAPRGCYEQVFALDLLGFGRSDKPLMAYSIEIWKQLVLDFCHEIVGAPAVLVGNSLGSLISLVVRHGLKSLLAGSSCACAQETCRWSLPADVADRHAS